MPLTVKTFTTEFVDSSRKTEAGSSTAELPQRTLTTVIRYPDAPGPFPLIVFSHGLNGHPDVFTKLLAKWAAAGYVVAAPAFPLTNSKEPGAAGNWTGLAQQPADVSFVIDQMLALNGDSRSPLGRRIDPNRIGVGGLSLGGATTYGITYNDCCRDKRVDVAEILAGSPLAIGGEYHFETGPPVLVMHGDEDPSLPYRVEADTYTKLAAPKWFVTLKGAGHSAPFEDDVTPYDDLVEKTTTDFWNLYLRGDGSARSTLEHDAVVESLSSLQHTEQ